MIWAGESETQESHGDNVRLGDISHRWAFQLASMKSDGPGYWGGSFSGLKHVELHPPSHLVPRHVLGLLK